MKASYHSIDECGEVRAKVLLVACVGFLERKGGGVTFEVYVPYAMSMCHSYPILASKNKIQAHVFIYPM